MMKPEEVTNVLNMTIMVLVFIVLIAAIAVTITNTIYYKKLWDDNGSTSISEETAKVMYFLNLFLGIASGIVFFIFIYRWYKIYNIAKTESETDAKKQQPMQRQSIKHRPKMPQRPLSPLSEKDEESEALMEQAFQCGSMLGNGFTPMTDKEMYRELGLAEPL